MGIEQSVIQQARQADLPSYLIARGEPLKKDGRQGYYHAEHNSLKINRNMYCWNSQGTKGNSLSFVQEFYGMSFLQAVQELTGEQRRQVNSVEPEKSVTKILSMPDKGIDAKRVWAYLVQTRKISQSAIKLCFDRHLIYQDTKGNVVFRMKDGTGETVGAEIRGTSPQPFKGIAGGSKEGYGFNIVLGENCERMIVFESSIDLLSFITLQGDKIQDRVLVSMAGVKENTLLNMAKMHGIGLHNVCCCVDQDDAGRQFAKDMSIKHGTKTYLPTTGAKDWNEMLTK